MGNPSAKLLPYQSQLPQDFYSRNYPSVTPTPTPPPATPDWIPPTPTPDPVPPVNNGGIYYGPNPPSNPAYGWLWTNGAGYIYVYVEPGVWSQIATNW